MTLTDTILFSAVAAFLSLDQVACFQMLFSRPIVAALILGVGFGDITEAVMIGVCFEFLFVRSIPVKERASADPTLATAAVLGGMWGVSDVLLASTGEHIHPLATAPFAAALGIFAAFFSRWFDVRLRVVNTELFHRLPDVVAVQITAILAQFLKSFVVYALTILAIQGALPKIMIALGSASLTAAALAWGALICISIAYAAVPFMNGKGGVLWLLGLAVGTATVLTARLSNHPLVYASAAAMLTVLVFGARELFRNPRRPVPGETQT